MQNSRWFKNMQRLMYKSNYLIFSGFLFFVFMVFFSIPLEAQNTSTRWKDYFSYTNVSHIAEINGLIFCATENGLFSYDPGTNETVKISKVDELNDVGITAFNYNSYNDLILVGYQRGEIDILGLDLEENQLEIPLHQSYTGNKIVNHITSFQNIAIISGEFGLASFDLENFEFMETTYFVVSGVYFGVKESAVLNGVIYAASDQGVYSNELNEFMANFLSWELAAGIPNTAFQQIVEFQGNIVASTNGSVYRFDGNSWSYLTYFPNLLDISTNGNVLTFTQLNQVTNYNESFGFLDSASFTDNLNTGLKVGNITYGGSELKGLINGSNEIHPDGPYSNKSWSVETVGSQLWIAPGGMNNYNDPQFNNEGFFQFNGEQWIHHKSEDMLNAKDILDIEVNPNDTTEFYVSSWFEHSIGWNDGTHIGMFKFKNNQLTEHYNSENSALEFRERVAGSLMDEEGNLWVSQAFAGENFKSLMIRRSADGTWQSVDLGANNEAGARKPVVYQGYAFSAMPRKESGVKITNMQEVYSITSNSSKGELPSDYVLSVAIDNDGVLWIGTELGLRILYNPIETIQSSSFQTEPIIIEQDGITEALLTDVQINDIEIDGANNKWIGTESSGAYCFSSDGTQTLFYFSAENSPIPSNKINDIEVNSQTGEVFFATDKGVVSYRSDAVDVGDSFGDVYSYPNPVRPGFNGNVVIKGLPNEADVRIVDIVGNLIYQTKASGGIATWDTKNSKGRSVATGIYLVLMTNKDASETKQTKIAIVR